MARIATCGFEWQDQYLDGVCRTYIGPTGLGVFGGATLPTYSQTHVRPGGSSWALKCNDPTAASSSTTVWNTAPSGSTVYYRCYYYFTAFPTTSPDIMGGGDATIVFDHATGTVQLWDTSGTPAQMGSNSAALVLNTWHKIEVKVTDNGVAAPTITGRLDGTQFATGTGSTAGNGLSSAYAFGFPANLTAPDASATVYLDDIALNDGSGAAQNSYPPDSSVVVLRPISDNARATAWVAGAGGTTNLWDALNNTPPTGTSAGSETNTTQIKSSSSTGSSAYTANMTSYTNAGVTGTVNVIVCVGLDAPQTAASATLQYSIGSNPAVASSGTVTAGASAAATAWPSATWAIHYGTITNTPTVTLGTSPTMTVKRINTSATFGDVCAMGIVVDFTPAGATVLTGAATIDETATGHPSTVAHVAGSATIDETASGIVRAAVLLAGAATVEETAAGVVRSLTVLSGSATLDLSAVGGIKQISHLSGAATVEETAAGQLTTIVRLTGTATLDVTETGRVGAIVPLTGAATIEETAGGALRTLVNLAGGATIELTASGALQLAVSLTGQATGDLTASGALTIVRVPPKPIPLIAGVSETVTFASYVVSIGVPLGAGVRETVALAPYAISIGVPLVAGVRTNSAFSAGLR